MVFAVFAISGNRDTSQPWVGYLLLAAAAIAIPYAAYRVWQGRKGR